MTRSASLSRWTVIATWLLLVLCSVVHRPKNAFAWDSFGYHLYLPAFFQHHDLALHDLGWVEEAMKHNDASGTLYQVSTLPDGARVIKYPMGLAVLWAPWYGVGHIAAKLTHAPTDGYSAPYQLAVTLGVLVYILLGLHWLRKALLSGFSDRVTAAVIVLVVFGTNYLDQAVFGRTMPHAVLFTLYAGIVRFTIRWQAVRAWGDAVKLAVLLGLAALSRPSEAVAILIPALWGLASVQARHAHWVALRNQWKQWALIGVILVLIGLPQFLYWKSVSGHFFVDSYNNPGEGFDLTGPHTGKFLFSFRKGWYIYTPLMLLATIGFLPLRKRWPVAFPALLVFFVVNLYLLSSWTCWWYADSFSSRAMVGSYAVMAIPLGALLAWAEDRKGLRRGIVVAACGACTLLNVFQQWQFSKGIIHSSRMTRAAYLAGFGRLHVPDGFESLLLVHRSYAGDDPGPDEAHYRRVALPARLTDLPPSDIDSLATDTAGGQQRRYLRLDKDHIYSTAVHLPFHTLTLTDHAWVTVDWPVYIPASGAPQLSVVMTMEHQGGSYAYHGFDVEKMPLRPGAWNTVDAVYLTPEVRSTKDPLVVYLWSRDTCRILAGTPTFTIHEPVSEP